MRMEIDGVGAEVAVIEIPRCKDANHEPSDSVMRRSSAN